MNSLVRFCKIVGVDINQLQDNLVRTLNPLFNNPVLNGSILSEVTLQSGQNNINHKLGRKPLGWFITDIDGAATIYRYAPFNETTLDLNSSATVRADIYVF